MALKFEQLTKKYGKKMVLNQIDLAINVQPKVVGLIGPNGVGKSTLLRLIAGVLEPTEGRITNDQVAQDYAKWASSHTSFIASGERGLINRLNTWENCQFFASIKGVDPKVAQKSIAKLAAELNFSPNMKTIFQELSTGQKKKAAVLVGAAMQTDFVLLDEPSNGLDISAQKDLADFILALKNNQHKLIFVSSHDTQMLSGVVDQYLFIKDKVIPRVVDHHLEEADLLAIYHNIYS